MLGDKNMNWRKFFILFGYVGSLGMSFTLMIVFLAAYLQNYKVMVYINVFNEAHI